MEGGLFSSRLWAVNSVTTPSPVKFGTDGWRGIIADDFTFENVRLVAQSTADYFSSVCGTDNGPERAVFIGYDVRFLSNRFAEATAEVFAGNGFKVVVMDRPYPTPYVSYEVQRRNFVGGIVITASHNPPDFNGFKVKAAFGGSAPPAMTTQIEAGLGRSEVRRSSIGIENVPPEGHYARHLKSLLKWDRISSSGLNVMVDSMHGSGGTLLEELLSDTGMSVRTIRGAPDPLFGGVHPEPMMPQLDPLAAAVVRHGCDVGLATDGDADRLGVIDGTGQFVSTLQVLPLLLLYAYRDRGWRGAVAHTVSQSQLVPRIARALELEVFETRIGFKNIAELMLRREILIGGEESGGVGLSRHLPERDGLFVNLFVLDMLAATGKPLRQLIEEMWGEFGEFHYERRDLRVPMDAGRRLLESVELQPPKYFAGEPVASLQNLDGAKLVLENDSWILFRRSGTEPVLRVYCEAPSLSRTQEILEAGLSFVEQFTSDGVH